MAAAESDGIQHLNPWCYRRRPYTLAFFLRELIPSRRSLRYVAALWQQSGNAWTSHCRPARCGDPTLMYHTKKVAEERSLALSASYCGGVTAADLTVSSGDQRVFDSSASFPGGVAVNGGTLVIGGNGGGCGRGDRWERRCNVERHHRRFRLDQWRSQRDGQLATSRRDMRSVRRPVSPTAISLSTATCR